MHIRTVYVCSCSCDLYVLYMCRVGSPLPIGVWQSMCIRVHVTCTMALRGVWVCTTRAVKWFPQASPLGIHLTAIVIQIPYTPESHATYKYICDACTYEVHLWFRVPSMLVGKNERLEISERDKDKHSTQIALHMADTQMYIHTCTNCTQFHTQMTPAEENCRDSCHWLISTLPSMCELSNPKKIKPSMCKMS